MDGSDSQSEAARLIVVVGDGSSSRATAGSLSPGTGHRKPVKRINTQTRFVNQSYLNVFGIYSPSSLLLSLSLLVPYSLRTFLHTLPGQVHRVKGRAAVIRFLRVPFLVDDRVAFAFELWRWRSGH